MIVTATAGQYGRYHLPTPSEISEAVDLAYAICGSGRRSRRERGRVLGAQAPDATLDEVAAELGGCSRQRVHQLEQRALARLMLVAASRLGRLPEDSVDLCAAWQRPASEAEVAAAWRDRERLLGGVGIRIAVSRAFRGAPVPVPGRHGDGNGWDDRWHWRPAAERRQAAAERRATAAG